MTPTRDHRRAGIDALKSADDAELITLVQARTPGDREREAAFEELVRRYRPLVHSCAVRYAPNHEVQEDLMQAGYVGLLSAINNFDPSFGCRLPAYARPCVLGEIKRYFRDKRGLVRVLRSSQELRAEVLQAEAAMTQQLSRTPTDQELAVELCLTTAEVREGRSAGREFQALSLDAGEGHPDGPVQLHTG
jgi:RNA polymerase sigma-B factor